VPCHRGYINRQMPWLTSTRWCTCAVNLHVLVELVGLDNLLGQIFPAHIREEVDVLIGDLYLRLKHCLFAALSTAYLSILIPCVFVPVSLSKFSVDDQQFGQGTQIMDASNCRYKWSTDDAHRLCLGCSTGHHRHMHLVCTLRRLFITGPLLRLIAPLGHAPRQLDKI
jgi:hypothetical protein